MIIADASQSFIQSPLGVVIASFIGTAVIATAGAVIRMMIDVGGMAKTMASIQDDIRDLKDDSDVMRWSDYSRRQESSSRRKRRGGD